MKDRNYNIIIFLLVLIFTALIVVGTIKDKKNYTAKRINKPIQAVNKNKESISVYEKINNKKEITMLTLGDGMANSMPVEDGDKWHNNIKKYLEDTYKIKVHTKAIWKEKSRIHEALENYNKEQTKNYDLIFVTLGEYNLGYGNTEKMASEYENLIKEIVKNNPNSDLYLIIQSSIRMNKTYPEEIIKIAKRYNLNVVDMRKAYENSGEDYDELTTNGILPNKKGYRLYTKEIKKSLENNIKNKR